MTALCALGTWQQFRNGEVYDLGFAVLFVVWPITLVGALTVLYLFTSD